MAPKRSVKNASLNNNNYNNLILSDVLCPICRTILIEPVTLPCNHGFCTSCLEATVANSNLVCPLCRVRIGSWLRTNKKSNKLVNNVLWEAIQKTFPEQVKNKLNGIDEYPVEDVPIIVTAPGEIRREYEQQKKRELVELQKQRDAEAKASEDLIKKLRDEEEQEEHVRTENMRLSEQMAKKLVQEYGFDPGPSSSLTKMNLRKEGPMDKLLKNMNQKKIAKPPKSVPKSVTPKEYSCKILCQDRGQADGKVNVFNKTTLLNLKVLNTFNKIISEGENSDSNDSIDLDCKYFKPIQQRVLPLSRKVPIVKVPGIIAIASTVIIGPPKGESKFTYSSSKSAFAAVKNIEFISTNYSSCKIITSSGSENIKNEKCLRKSTNKSETVSSRKQIRSKLEETESSQTNSLSQKSLVRDTERTADSNKALDKLVFTPSKRKRIRESPVIAENHSIKKAKVTNGSLPISPPLYGCNDARNLDELQMKNNNNGAIFSSDKVANQNSPNKNCETNRIKKIQEEEDFKFAKQLHEELNHSFRYRCSARNSINNVEVKNITRSSARQVTLKEIVSQKASKIP